MESIHLKTVDPISQDLLRSAAEKRIPMNWERFEKLQPQDGFLRLGLSCPYGCLQGPCRIDPFGRGADKGLCGLDRDGMVAAFLLRLVMQGALETAGGTPLDTVAPTSRLTAASLERIGGAVSAADLHQSIAMLSRPAASAENIVRQALRLGVYALHLAAENEGKAQRLSCSGGYGLMAGTPIIVGVAGRATPETVASLIETASGQTDADYRVLSLGDWIPLADRYLPIVCSSGEAELSLSSGRIAAVLFGPGADPGIFGMCQTLDVPMIDAAAATDPQSILETAKTYQTRRAQAGFAPDASRVGEWDASVGVETLKALFKKTGDPALAVIGGADTPHQPHGHLPISLAKALRDSGTYTAAWGDAAFWMVKDGLGSASMENPVMVIDPEAGPVQAAAALAELGKLNRLSGICFTGVKGCRDLAAAVGLAAAGLRVAIASPLPIWGSGRVRELLSEQMGACGGELMHFDHPAQTEEIFEWLKKK